MPDEPQADTARLKCPRAVVVTEHYVGSDFESKTWIYLERSFHVGLLIVRLFPSRAGYGICAALLILALPATLWAQSLPASKSEGISNAVEPGAGQVAPSLFGHLTFAVGCETTEQQQIVRRLEPRRTEAHAVTLFGHPPTGPLHVGILRQAQSDQDTTIDHVLMGALMALQGADGIVSAYGFGAGTLNEVNPILKPLQDKPKAFTAAKVGTYSAVSLLLYLLHKKSPRPVRYTVLALIAVQSYVVVHNWRQIQ